MSNLAFLLFTMLFVLHPLQAGVVSVTDSSTAWTVVPNIDLDPINDMQTGHPESDLVGIVTDPGFFTGWDGTSVYYRLRLGKQAAAGVSQKGVVAWIGMDVDGDGRLDMFIGADNAGSNSFIGFFAPGAGLNDGPSTTTINTPLAQYESSETVSNYNYQLVNNSIDPLGSSAPGYDLNADGNTDVYLSIKIQLLGASGSATLEGALLGLMGKDITSSTQLHYVLGTATQDNSINEDIGGVNGQINSSLTWQQLGGLSIATTPSGVVVPEPSSVIPMLVCAAGLLSVGRWRRKA
jgi:hypothetical protein